MEQIAAILDAFGRPMVATEKRYGYKEMTNDFFEAFSAGGQSTAGEVVNAKMAMTVMAFFACVRNISEDIAKLPKKVRQELDPRGSKNLPGHPVSKVLKRPNDIQNKHVFWQTIIGHALTEKGGFAEIVTDGAGNVAAMYILNPRTTHVVEHPITGRPYFHIDGMGTREALPPESVLHIHGLGCDGLTGYNIPQLAKQLIGAAIALQKYRGSFFGNGAQPAGILQHPAVLSPEAQENLRRQFEKRYAGAENAHSIMTLEEGMTWQQLSIDPDRAQLVDVTNITTVDICRIFRMPPHKVQHLANATFTNIEQQNIEYDTDTLDPWVDKLRSEIDFKLFRDSEVAQGIGCHINMNAIMRADTAARTAYYKELYYMGAMSANDVSELEDRNPVEGGDRYFVQQNLIPVDKIDAAFDAKNAPKEPAPAPAPMPAPDTQARVKAGLLALIEDKIIGLLRAELDKAKRSKDIDDFFLKQEIYVGGNIHNVVGAVAVSLASFMDVETVSKWYAEEHVKESRRCFDDDDFTAWQSGERAKLAAKQLLTHLCEENMLCNTAA